MDPGASRHPVSLVVNTCSVRRFRILLIFRYRPRNYILLFRPRAQINLLAALRAERAKLVRLYPFDFFAAGWAIDHRCHDDERGSEIAEGKLEGHVTFEGLGLHVAALAGEAYPQHVFVG